METNSDNTINETNKIMEEYKENPPATQYRPEINTGSNDSVLKKGNINKIIGEFNHGSDNPFDLAKPMLNGNYVYKRIAIRNNNPEVVK